MQKYKGNERSENKRYVVPYRNKQLKNVLQGRSYFRKGLEAHFTVLIEFIWGKERIGSGNSIEMGDIWRSGGKEHYRKDAKDLTPKPQE
jgi:monofunctional biosynthetic peptidoglycan transglycosylase